MTDLTVTGTYTPQVGQTDPQIQEALVEQVDALVGKGVNADPNLITITHNDDGTVTWSYTLEQPDPTASQHYKSAFDKLQGMSTASSTDNSFTEVYEIMVECFLMANKMREASDTASDSLAKQQISSLKDAAADIRSGAGWQLAAGIVMGVAQFAAGAMELKGAASMSSSLGEATELTSEAMQANRVARTIEMGPAPKAPQPELELDEPNAVNNGQKLEVEEDDDAAPRGRKNADADLNDPAMKNNASDNDLDVNQKSEQEMALETQESQQKQQHEANETESEDDFKRFQRARSFRDKADNLNKQADIKMRGISQQEALSKGISEMVQGFGSIFNSVGQYMNSLEQSDSKTAEAAAAAAAAFREGMVKHRDNSYQFLDAARQGLQQSMQIETDMAKKVWA